jgi:protein arginine kinase activator
MSHKCQECGKPATYTITELKNGQKIEKHLCQKCAGQQEGFVAAAHTPINELLSNFVQQHSGLVKQQDTACEHCGMTWSDFRQNGQLGCQHDYDLFEKDLTPLIQRAHEGATHHVGKVPSRRGGTGVPMKRSTDITRLRKELMRAVEAEDYELAAKIRDKIKEAETAS